MYAYDANTLPYPDNLSISSTETAFQSQSSSAQTSASVAATNLLKMNSTFISEDPARIGAGYTAQIDPSGSLLLDHSNNNQMQHQQMQPSALQTSQQQLGQMARFSSGSESRTQTPGAKRKCEDEESDAGESEGNSRGIETAVVEKRTGRRKIKIEYIEDKSRRHITFSKRKAGIMKKAYELSTLTGTQVLLLVVSETGLVYTFTTPKLQPIVTQAEGKNLIQACLSVPDQPGDRILQPIPTESNSYMSQPRSHHAAAAAAAAASALSVHEAAAVHHAGLIDDHKHDTGSPVTGVGHTPAYLQYQYGQSAMAQAVAAASAGTPGAYTTNMMPQATANGGMQYTAVPGYASYPNSNSQSQHHSPITTAASHTPQQGTGGISAAAVAAAAAAASMPNITSLASYHHGYNAPQHSHYACQQPNGQQLPPALPPPHSSQGTAGDMPSGSGASVSAALAAVGVVTGGQHPQSAIPTHPGSMHAPPYMGNHYWTPQGLASPQQQPQQQQQQQQTASFVHRTGYAGSG
ncbi:transcription factor of the MADS box [Coemansia sp. RSA 1365]|nr:transcription factor of the MADS box [Coemansia sp. RSA 1365]